MSGFYAGIVHHPSRDPYELVDQVEPDVVITDINSDGPGPTHYRVLYRLNALAHEEGEGWAVVLEDDAKVVPNFPAELVACLDYAPGPVVSLYSGTGYPAQYQRRFIEAHQTDARWIMHAHMRHAVGYAIHSSELPGLLEFSQRLVKASWAMDDAINEWLHRHTFGVAYSNPSLVDHCDGPPAIKSRTHRGRATFGRKRPRRAHRFGVPMTWDDTTVIV